MERGRTVVPQPGGAVVSHQVGVARRVDRDLAPGILQGRPVECVPFVTAIDVQLQYRQVVVSTVRVQRIRVAVPQPRLVALAAHVDAQVGVDGDAIGLVADGRPVESMPLVRARGVHCQDENVRHAIPRIQRLFPPVALPGRQALARRVDDAVLDRDGVGGIAESRGPIEGMPLVRAVAVQLEHDQVVGAALAMGVQRGRVAVPEPGRHAAPGHVHIAVIAQRDRRGIVLAVRAVERVPLVGAVAVKLHDEDIGAAAVGMDGVRVAIALPRPVGIARDVDVAVRSHGDAPAFRETARPVERVPGVVGDRPSGAEGR